MQLIHHGGLEVLDCEPDAGSFRLDVLAGLSRIPRALPCKYFYDQAGAALFERICALPEYYLTRTELTILQAHVGAMAAALGPRCRLVELGSGAGVKTRMLLERLDAPAAYVPIDISRQQLLAAAEELARAFPHVKVAPVCADYTRPVCALPDADAARTVVYFPGSTIGNFTPPEARTFLGWIAELCGKGGGLLLGADLRKDQGVLHRAYNDAAGVTAAFNLNLLARINRELQAEFDLAGFRHRAFFDDVPGRIEMQLVSERTQAVRVAGQEIAFAAGEAITTEYSYKYSLRELSDIAAAAGLETREVWTDAQEWFAVLYCARR